MHEGELFTRWLQFGVFSSTFRTHCEACEIRVWMYPEPYRTHMFRTFHLRQSLQPCLLPTISLLVLKLQNAPVVQLNKLEAGMGSVIFVCYVYGATHNTKRLD